MLEIEDYAFPFGLCLSRPIMLKIMLAYCINAQLGRGFGRVATPRAQVSRRVRLKSHEVRVDVWS